MVSVTRSAWPRIATDMAGYGLRLGVRTATTFQPWLSTGRFQRPDFECIAGLVCTREGWLLQAGLTLPLAPDERAPGPHWAVLGGAGAAFADDTALAYFLGLGFHWRRWPRLTPAAEIRWEHIGGITLPMIAAGLRLDL